MIANAARRSTQLIAETGCCPRFDPQQAPASELALRSTTFVREQVRTLFHVPLNMARKVAHATQQIAAAGARAERPLLLCAATSPWRSELFIETSKEVPEVEMVELSGSFMTKVFEGPFRDVPRWVAEMQRLVSARSERCQRVFFHYTTCPDCGRAYEENYVVLYAQLA